jgi:hypothetical protein
MMTGRNRVRAPWLIAACEPTPWSTDLRIWLSITNPFRTATPDSAINPTAAEIENGHARGVACVSYDPAYLTRTSGPHGTVIAYAEHIKSDAVASLSDEEGAVALKRAADVASSAALRTLQEFHAQDQAIENTRIRDWCANEARQFIRTVIEYHDNDHEELLSRLEQARR